MEFHKSEKWTSGHEGRYSIDISGAFRSYCGPEPQLRTVVIKNGCAIVRLYNGRTHVCKREDWQIGSLVAQAFLDTTHFVYKDGDRSNAALCNLLPMDGALAENEKWIDGYEYLYSVTSDGEVFSYKGNIKERLKICTVGGRGPRVTLRKGKAKKTVYLNYLLLHHF